MILCSVYWPSGVSLPQSSSLCLVLSIPISLSFLKPRTAVAVSTYVLLKFFHFISMSHSLLVSASEGKRFFSFNINFRFV